MASGIVSQWAATGAALFAPRLELGLGCRQVGDELVLLRSDGTPGVDRTRPLPRRRARSLQRIRNAGVTAIADDGSAALRRWRTRSRSRRDARASGNADDAASGSACSEPSSRLDEVDAVVRLMNTLALPPPESRWTIDHVAFRRSVRAASMRRRSLPRRASFQ